MYLVYSCQPSAEAPSPTVPSVPPIPQSAEGTIILGKKLENPYAVHLMKQAYKNLVQKEGGRIQSNSPVQTTHYYVRFLPKDWPEYDRLKADNTLKLYDIPLDYDIQVNGNHYHDPSIPATHPTWQYTSVKKDYIFPQGIQYEILDELYLPEQDASFLQKSSATRIAGKSLLDALVDEAMILTGNFSDTLKTAPTSGRTTAYRPYGFIRVFDTRLQRLIPLVGVRMRARRWFDIRETFTNQDGYYDHTDFKRAANYALFFETDAFDVRSGTFGQAWINGPKQDIGWSVDMWDGVNRFYSHVFRGARRYHYGDIGGLKRPLVWSKLKYAAYDKNNEGTGDAWGNWDFTGTFPDMRIWRYNDNQEQTSDEIFSVTVHETAHASHIQLMNAGEIQYLQISRNIRESWATGVEWFIISMEYRERGIANYATETYNIGVNFPIDRAYQYWDTVNSDEVYTSLFINLIDDYNERNEYPDGPIENVTGYTMAGIESGLLKHVYGLSSLSAALKANKPTGVTDAQIDDLLSAY